MWRGVEVKKIIIVLDGCSSAPAGEKDTPLARLCEGGAYNTVNPLSIPIDHAPKRHTDRGVARGKKVYQF